MQLRVKEQVFILRNTSILKFDEIVNGCEDYFAAYEKSCSIMLSVILGFCVEVSANNEPNAVERVPVYVEGAGFDGLP